MSDNAEVTRRKYLLRNSYLKFGYAFVALFLLTFIDFGVQSAAGWNPHLGIIAFLLFGGSGLADFVERWGLSRLNGCWIVLGPFGLLAVYRWSTLRRGDSAPRRSKLRASLPSRDN